MSQNSDYLEQLGFKVAQSIKRAPEQLHPFLRILKQNWYDTQQSIRTITDQQFQKMRIPFRIVTAIRQVMGEKKKVNKQQQKLQVKEKQVQQQKRASLTQSIISKIVNTLIKQIKTECYSQEQIGKILERLYKIITNIAKQPFQWKFRTLKKANKTIQDTIYNHPSCIKFIQEIGFKQGEQGYVLHVFEVHELFGISEQINIHLQKYSSQNNVNKPNQKIINSNQNMFLNVKQFPKNQQDIHQQFNKQKLDQMNYAEGLEKLIQYRQKIMSTVPKNRRTRIYPRSKQMKIVNTSQIDFQSALQLSDDKVIFAYWKQFIDSVNKNTAFQSKRKLQFQFLLKQKIHKQTLIRIRLPNDLTLQGYFGPLQTLNSVFSWCADIIVGDLYLYTAPPVKKMTKQLNMSLDALESVPMGCFYLGINGDWYIKNQYTKIIQK